MDRNLVHSFRRVEPSFETEQAEGNRWMAAAQERCERKHGNEPNSQRIQKRIDRFGCSPRMISKRAHELEDFRHQNWNEMKIFSNDLGGEGARMSERNQFFGEAVTRQFEKLYRSSEDLPEKVVHVTCTGYDAPSGAQKVISKHRSSARVFHCYHMGCYASLPAVEMAVRDSARSDIVHTELCTLHLNPAVTTPEQIVVNSLFADGTIKYSIGPAKRGFLFERFREEILPDSVDDMTWTLGDFGFNMTLSRDVPTKIGSALNGFVQKLTQGISESDPVQYAIHPGGPRIIDGVKESLKLSEEQVALSRKVLFERGNMSSATLPFVWDEVLQEREIASGTWVVSLAFGPGLTVYGALSKKVES